VRRTERRLFELNEEIQRLRHEERLVEGELGFHRHLSDDAVRDAVVSDLPADRAEARHAAKDVARLEGALDDVRRRIERLELHRDQLLDRLKN
jgi:hypothetical protein